MDSVRQDVVYALRTLRRAPGFTVVATLTLALGIGANSALFALVDAVMLQPAGVMTEPDRIVVLRHASDGGSFSWPDFEDVSAGAGGLEVASAVHSVVASVGADGGAVRVAGALVDDGYLSVFGVRTQAGRDFTETEVVAAAALVILSDELALQVFGGDDPIGRTIPLNGVAYTVVGVAPSGFRGGRLESPPRFWVPATRIADFSTQMGARVFSQRHWRIFDVVARLAPGVSIPMAQAELSAIAGQLETIDPSARSLREFLVFPGHLGALTSGVRDSARQSSRLFAGVVGLVLLLACLNVANLLTTRASARHAEMALRRAIGAPSARLVRQLLTESLVLSLAGGVVGVAAGLASVPMLARLILPASLDVAVGLDPAVIAFALALSIATGVAFGLMPAWRGSKVDLASPLKGTLTVGRRTDSGPAAAWSGRGALVIAQIAFSMMLLVGAGLLVRTSRELQRVDPGFDAANVLAATIDPGLAGMNEERGAELLDDLLAGVRALPGVTAASLTSDLPLDPDGSAMGLYFEGSPEGAEGGVSQTIVAEDLFSTLGIRLLRGRDFSPQDRVDAPGAVIVNQALADRFWPGREALGQRLGVSGPDGPWYRVIGVVDSHRQRGLRQEARPHLFWSMRQIYAMMSGASKSLVVRTSGDPLAVLPSVRRQLGELAPELPLFGITTLSDWLGESMARERRLAGLLAAFAGVALVLATIGLYGVVSHNVARRRSEIGIRLALGARPQDAVRRIVREAIAMGAGGMAVGALGSVATAGWIRSLLYGVEPLDPLVLGGVSLVMIVTALVASWLPARRASRVDPLEALRTR